MIWFAGLVIVIAVLVWDENRLERQERNRGECHPQDGYEEWTLGLGQIEIHTIPPAEK